MFLKKFSCVSAHLSKLETTGRRCCFHSAVSSRGTNFVVTVCTTKLSVKISRHGPEEIPTSVAVSAMVSVQSALTKSCTCAITLSFLLNAGCLKCSSFSRDVLPFSKWWSHSKTCVQLVSFSWNAVLIMSKIVVRILSCFAQNLIHTHCSVLCDNMNTTHCTCVTILFWWLHQTEWFQWGITDWRHGTCPGKFRKASCSVTAY